MSLLSYAEWYTQGRLAPYIKSHRDRNGLVTMTEVAQPAGDMSDPPVSDLVVLKVLTGPTRHRSDFGVGLFSDVAQPGDLYVCPPEFATRVQVTSDHGLRILALPTDRFRQAMAAARPDGNHFDFGHLHGGRFNSRVISGMLDQMWAAADEGDDVTSLFMEGAALIILSELVRLSKRPVPTIRGGLAAWAEKRCRDYLQARFAEDVSVSELAAIANLSPFHFIRMFKRSTGLSPHAYQRQLRVERAKELLAITDMSIADIAVAVGYDTAQSLSKMFRSETSNSPGRWRREMKT